MDEVSEWGRRVDGWETVSGGCLIKLDWASYLVHLATEREIETKRQLIIHRPGNNNGEGRNVMWVDRWTSPFAALLCQFNKIDIFANRSKIKGDEEKSLGFLSFTDLLPITVLDVDDVRTQKTVMMTMKGGRGGHWMAVAVMELELERSAERVLLVCKSE